MYETIDVCSQSKDSCLQSMLCCAAIIPFILQLAYFATEATHSQLTSFQAEKAFKSLAG